MNILGIGYTNKQLKEIARKTGHLDKVKEIPASNVISFPDCYAEKFEAICRRDGIPFRYGNCGIIVGGI